MEFTCIEYARDGGWSVEAINTASEGEVSRILFMGANAEQLAREYAAWKNGQSS